MTDAVDVPTLAKQMLEAAERASARDWSAPGFTQIEMLYVALASPSNITAVCQAFLAMKERAEKAEATIAELREHKLPTNAAIIAMAGRQAKPHDT